MSNKKTKFFQFIKMPAGGRIKEPYIASRVSKDGREITLEPRVLVGIGDELAVKRGHKQTAKVDCNHPISWGMPAKIAQCSDDKQCPHCGSTKEDGFDLGSDWGVVFGARCGNCNFSF